MILKETRGNKNQKMEKVAKIADYIQQESANTNQK